MGKDGAPSRSGLAATRSTKVLLVDDDDEIRGVLEDILTDEGSEVYQARGGSEALALLKTVVPDLIILDLMMPEMNGWTLYAILQQDPVLAKIPVVVLSAASHLLPEGSVMQLQKPIDLPTLVRLLDTVGQPQSARRMFLRSPQ